MVNKDALERLNSYVREGLHALEEAQLVIACNPLVSDAMHGEAQRSLNSAFLALGNLHRLLPMVERKHNTPVEAEDMD